MRADVFELLFSFHHADGMVRFIDRDTVLINNYADLDPELRKRLLERLKWEGYHVEELHYNKPRCSKNSWAYLNFLQVAGHIFVSGILTTDSPLKCLFLNRRPSACGGL